MLIAIVVPFILTVIVGKRKGIDKLSAEAAAAAEANAPAPVENAAPSVESERELKAYLDGEVISLQAIGDGVFSAGMVGDGLAIKPSNETVCAPVSGKITVLPDASKHAVGMTLSNGAEILIRVGIDTVSMTATASVIWSKSATKSARGHAFAQIQQGENQGRGASRHRRFCRHQP